MKQISKILTPVKLGDFQLKNRIVMAPLTRIRADPKTGVPNDLMAEYYQQRAGYGLILTECSQISDRSVSFPGSGGIYSQEQVEGWQNVVQKVHQKNGVIFLQIWHCGRATSQQLIQGQIPLAPSSINRRGINRFCNQDYPVPQEMSEEDIKMVINQFKQGAINAKKAGFDGLELHAANGYLVDQFLREFSNQRTDKYGGSIENRSRFMLEVLDALIEVYGPKRVGVRFSPTGRFGDMYDSNPLELMKYILKELEKRDILFVELKRHGVLEGDFAFSKEIKDKEGRDMPNVQIPNFFETFRQLYSGTIIGNDGFTPETATEAVEKGIVDLVSFGHLAVANPDLPERILNNWPVNQSDKSTLYTPGAKGYTDYTFYQQ